MDEVPRKVLRGKIALGEAGATVYCAGRSSRGLPATPGGPETIEETAEQVTAAGGRGIAVRVDHTDFPGLVFIVIPKVTS
jgi:hypothetical protein